MNAMPDHHYDPRTLRRALLVHSLLCVAAVAAALFAVPALAVTPGAGAPPFSLPGRAGGPVTLAQYQGRVVYLGFWDAACLPCRQAFPWMNALQARYRSRGLEVVGIGVDSVSDSAQQFLASHRAEFAIAFDTGGITLRSYGLRGSPAGVLIDAEGRVVAVSNGYSDTAMLAMERSIERTLGAPSMGFDDTALGGHRLVSARAGGPR
jgi:peroxiredoxin